MSKNFHSRTLIAKSKQIKTDHSTVHQQSRNNQGQQKGVHTTAWWPRFCAMGHLYITALWWPVRLMLVVSYDGNQGERILISCHSWGMIRGNRTRGWFVREAISQSSWLRPEGWFTIRHSSSGRLSSIVEAIEGRRHLQARPLPSSRAKVRGTSYVSGILIFWCAGPFFVVAAQ